MDLALTQAEAGQVVEVLRELAGEHKLLEQRRHKRRSVALGLYVRVLTQGRARHALCQVLLVNVSARGVCMLTPRPMHVGDRVLIRLPFKEGGGWLVLASIRNCQRTSDGAFRAGAEFVSWLEDPTGETPVPREWITSWN